MKTSRLAIAAAGALAAALVAAVPLHSSPSVESAFAARILAAHNRERDRIGVPPLQWNGALAVQAREWANSLARRRAFEHSRNTKGFGENLWMGTSGAYTLEEMIGRLCR